MMPELGLISLIIALTLSFLQAVFPLYASFSGKEKFYFVARPLSLGVAFFITLAFIILLYSFAQDDFSLKYVVLHSNSALPFQYKLSSVWAGHEGSLLLWIFMLALWMLCFNLTSGALPKIFVSRILSCLGGVLFGFILFILFTSNPFLRELPGIPLDGLDLNPLLQDPGLIFHPPLLYMGYVGSSIMASFAVAALWENKMYSGFAAWVRPWILASFGFLTLGITLGSFWAYYELGWGGWWFWDPVENASFMPWLIMLALIHSLIVLRKRHLLLSWTLLLMILSFAFCLLGTFLVRSGVLSSVHAFATDSRRGIFILILSSTLVGIAFVLYGYRSKTEVRATEVRATEINESALRHSAAMDLSSREALLLLNSILIVITAASILLGTLFPLGYEALTHQKISVGFPYFNLIFIIFMMPILLSIPLGPFLHWGSNSYKMLVKKMGATFFCSLFLSVCLIFWLQYQRSIPWKFLSVLGFFLGFWVILGTVQRLGHKIKLGGPNAVSVGAWGMILAHVGVGVMVLGVTLVSQYQIEKDVRVSPQDTIPLNQYKIQFLKLETTEGENFVGYRGYFEIKDQDKTIATLRPEKRTYVVQNTSLSETAIDSNFWRDIYIALGEPISKNNWSVRMYYKPGIRWIWLGAGLIAFACVVLLVFKSKKAKG